MSDEDWQTGYARAVGVWLNGDAILAPDERGRRIQDDTFLMLFNASADAIDWTMPGAERGRAWVPVIDTATGHIDEVDGRNDSRSRHDAGATVKVEGRSLLVLERVD